MSVVRKQTQQQNNASGTYSFYNSNLKTASESPAFNNTKRSCASPAPSSIIINNKETTTFNNNNNNNNNFLWIGMLIVKCYSRKWTTPHFCGGFLLKNTTIGFSHTPKPSPMTSGHHTSWNSDMQDNYSLVSRGVNDFFHRLSISPSHL